MPTRAESELAGAFTGLVVESLAVSQDPDASTVACDACGRQTLGGGDEVTVALSCYEVHSWEIQGVYGATHARDTVAETMGVRAETQAVVEAVLETVGYRSPDGQYHPDALTLGAVSVLDYSRTGEGYPPG